MECYSEQTCATFVDGELAADEAQRLRDHLASCPRCRDLVEALRAENRVLAEFLRELPEEAVNLARFPRQRWSWVWGDLAVLTAVLVLGSIISVCWDQISIPVVVEWFNPFTPSGFTSLMFNVSDYFARGGTAMLTEYAAFVGGFVLLSTLGGSALLLRRRWRQSKPGLCLLIALLALRLPSFGLERRHQDFIIVPTSETIDDTLLAAGKTVRVEGVINGDLLVFGQTVEVPGTVKGDVVSFAKRTVVSGSVEGHIFSCAQSLDLDGQVGRSIYGWAQSLRMGNRSRVGDGIVVGSGDFILEGEVNRSVTIFSSNADVSGNIGRELSMAGGHLTLTDTARVGGNLTARVRHVQDVHIADSATIAGKRDIRMRVRKSQFTRPRFYLHQVIWLAAAMLVGWLGLLLFPAFSKATTQAVGSGWLSLGLGLGILAGVPVAMVVIGITLVGLPISLMLLALYLTGLYLAKIWVGAYLGRIILKRSGPTKSDWVLGLLVGLLILTVVGFIPYLGGLVRLGVVCLGLGAFAAELYRASRPPITA